MSKYETIFKSVCISVFAAAFSFIGWCGIDLCRAVHKLSWKTNCDQLHTIQQQAAELTEGQKPTESQKRLMEKIRSYQIDCGCVEAVPSDSLP